MTTYGNLADTERTEAAIARQARRPTMYTKLSDFDNCHGVEYMPSDHDLTSIDIYVFSGHARRLVASFQDYFDAMNFAEDLALKIRDQSGAKILVVLRTLDFIICQVNIA